MQDNNNNYNQSGPILQSNSVQHPQSLTRDINVSRSTGSRKLIITLISAAVLLVVILLGWNLYTQSKLKKVENQLQQKQADPQTQSKKESRDLINKVGQLIVLPKDEEPTIATVSDLDKLKGQEFFANAQLGDKVLIYYGAKKAILYRPTDNKIIELAPLVDSLPGSPSATGTPTSSSTAQ